MARTFFAFTLLALLALTGGTWWLCRHSDSLAFLPADSGAEWIIDPRPPENMARLQSPLRTIFKQRFILANQPEHARISLRAFTIASVTVNGRELPALQLAGKNWKSTTAAACETWLRAGTNEIIVSVTNRLAPPALCLRLQVGTETLGSDESWLASPITNHWQNARLATRPPLLPEWNPLNDHRRAGWFRRTELELAGWTLGSVILFFGVRFWLNQQTRFNSEQLIYLLLAAVLTARVALLINDLPKLPHATGFDALGHEEYVRYLQDHRALPQPDGGWEMHQPPLYYLVSAGLMSAAGVSAGQDNAVTPLRFVNGLIGLVHVWLILLCLRRIFPQNFSAQAVGLLIASFLPVNLCLSFYITNDPLTGLWITLAIYFFLRLIELPEANPRLALALGLSLGAALLTKLSALPAIPVFFSHL
jgi:hypothetical protein